MVCIRELQEKDILPMVRAFNKIGWNKPASQFERYLREQNEGKRQVIAAFVDEEFAGFLTILSVSRYLPFKAKNIPEINDFNVLPQFRRRGIGTKLMDKAEDFIARTSRVAGLGVGLDADYGAAHRLYVLRGYVPDGKGIVRKNRSPKYGERVTVDDDLNLYLTKDLSRTFMQQSIAHLALVVADYDEAIRFYTEKLNFTLVEDTLLTETKRWVLVAPKNSDGCQLLLAKADGDEQRSRIGNQTGGRVFLFLRTDDFWRDYEDYLSKGVEFVREPKTEVYGTVAVFTDLYGNLWDLIEFSNK